MISIDDYIYWIHNVNDTKIWYPELDYTIDLSCLFG
jgi:hypothetical protein